MTQLADAFELLARLFFLASLTNAGIALYLRG
jgi:hypothetical protein